MKKSRNSRLQMMRGSWEPCKGGVDNWVHDLLCRLLGYMCIVWSLSLDDGPTMSQESSYLAVGLLQPNNCMQSTVEPRRFSLWSRGTNSNIILCRYPGKIEWEEVVSISLNVFSRRFTMIIVESMIGISPHFSCVNWVNCVNWVIFENICR